MHKYNTSEVARYKNSLLTKDYHLSSSNYKNNIRNETQFKAATPFYIWSYICKFVTINQAWACLKYEMKWFCKMSISIFENWPLSPPRLTICLRKCDILSVGQVDTATKYSSPVHPKSIKGWRKWPIDGEQALRKRATRVTPVNVNASSSLPCTKLALLEDSAWELLSAWNGVLCDILGAAEDLRVEGSRLDISVNSESLGSTFSFDFSSLSSSVKSMASFSFFFSSVSRSISKAALVGCKEGHQFQMWDI